MMCLLTTAASAAAGGGASSNNAPNGQNGSKYSSYDAMDSPPSSESSENSKSPPQLSPQEGNLFVDLHTGKGTADLLLSSPQMALLTPQLKESSEQEKVVTSMTPEPDLHHDHDLIMLEPYHPRKTVPFTFCNMRQNIFDLKKKRGRKNNGGIQKKPSCLKLEQPQIPSETAINTHYEKPCPLRKRKNLTTMTDLEFCSKSPKNNDDDLDFEDEIVIDDDEEESSDEFNDSKEIVEDVVDGLLSSIFEPPPSKKIEKLKSLVPLTDLFQKTPLSSFSCFGCSKLYTNQDTYCVDLKCQTLLLTCSQCHWWTNRRVQFSHDPVFFLHHQAAQ